jgi:hypothetical protein
MTVTEESVRVTLRKPVERVACRAYLGANQSNIASASDVKVSLAVTEYDLGENFDTATNYRFTAPVSGLYNIVGQVTYVDSSVQADKSYKAMIFMNGTAISGASVTASVAEYVSAVTATEAYLDKDDYIELFAYTSGTGDTVDIYGTSAYTYLVIRLITKEGIKQ